MISVIRSRKRWHSGRSACLAAAALAGFAASFSAGPARAAAAAPVTLLDLVPETRPTGTPRFMPMFTDTRLDSGATGSACMASIASAPAATQAPAPLNAAVMGIGRVGTAPVHQVLASGVWKLASWVVNPALPNFCAGTEAAATPGSTGYTSKVISAAGASTIAVTDNKSRVPLQFSFRQDSMLLAVNSNAFWDTTFGAGVPLFRAASDYKNVGWVNAFVQRSLDPAVSRLSLYRGLQLSFDGALVDAHVNTCCVAAPAGGKLPSGASTSYNPLIHGTRLRLNIIVQYRLTPQESAAGQCARGAPAAAAICRNNGRYFEFNVTLFDERYAYVSQWKPSGGSAAPQFKHDPGTDTLMFRQSLEALMSPDQKAAWFARNVNPFRQPGQRFAVSADVMPMIRSAIFQTAQQSFVSTVTGATVPGLPAPLPGETINNDNSRTDAAYLGHFVVNGINFGYEVSGISAVSFAVYGLKLTALP